MSIPPTIPFSAVVLGDRVRSSNSNVEALADNIEEVGLIQPLVLVETGPAGDSAQYQLVAGGRRYAALASLGTETLYHATTGDPARPGFILVGEEATVLDNLLLEINENLNREDVDWRDNIKGVVRAFRLANAQANERGESVSMRTFSAMIGYPVKDLQAACVVHDQLIADPEKFSGVFSVRAALSLLLKENATAVAKTLEDRSKVVRQPVPRQEESEPTSDGTTALVPDPIVIPLSETISHGDSLALLSSGVRFDHIVCDPDYGLDKGILAVKDWSPDTSSVGVAQSSVDESMTVLFDFIRLAFTATHDYSFLIFWYDLDHHEKLQRHATSVGWAVQRWPIIWHKTDARGNAAPGFNFCKNIEYAMICRKPGATLVSPQMSSVIALPSGNATKEFNHPFAKPKVLWQKLFSAIATPGQSVFDPFMGSGSSVVSALDFGLTAHGCELQQQHYLTARTNIQQYYHGRLGPNVSFT